MAGSILQHTPGTKRRVKLYMLNKERQWDDKGTGHVNYVYRENLRGMAMVVFAEETGIPLLESKIQSDTAYQKQQETLIVWSEQKDYDLALSFQEPEGCDEIWETICTVQGRLHASIDISPGDKDHMEDGDLDESSYTDELSGNKNNDFELPPCELSKLEEISELMREVLQSPLKREKFAQKIENEDYIRKLLDVFHMCEDLDNTDGLHILYFIFKNIFSLNKHSLCAIMFADDVIMDVVGVLEYDPSHGASPVRHRDYLQDKSRFKEVLPMTNAELLLKVHQTYRIQYIQDVILPTPSVFEENMFAALNSFIFCNKAEIVSILQEDEKFMKALFEQMISDETEDTKRRDLVLFLKEFCTFSQSLQPECKDALFKTISNLGILQAIEVILSLEDDVIRSASIDIFSFIVEHSPSMVREYIIQAAEHDDEDLLINLVIEQMIGDNDPELGGAMQLMGIIRLLIDPDNMLVGNSNKTEKSEFLAFFYKKSMHVLTAPLFANTGGDSPSKDDFQTVQLLSIILDLLTFCAEHHTYHFKNYVLHKDLLRRVLVLLKSKHTFLALCALRFMRRILSLKDEFYNRYIVRGNLFLPVVDAFIANGDKYNLLNSAVIEMFEYIRTEDVKSLCTYIIENHSKAFEHVEYVQTFEQLKTRYEELQQPNIRETFEPALRDSYQRDLDAHDDEQDMWLEEGDEMDDDPLIPDIIRSNKLDVELEQKLSKFMEYPKKGAKEVARDSPPRLFNRTSPITINIRTSPNSTSPSSSPFGSPIISPNISPHRMLLNSPISPKEDQRPQVVTNKSGLMGLVDYDADSDEDDGDEENSAPSDLPASKRPRLST